MKNFKYLTFILKVCIFIAKDAAQSYRVAQWLPTSKKGRFGDTKEWQIFSVFLKTPIKSEWLIQGAWTLLLDIYLPCFLCHYYAKPNCDSFLIMLIYTSGLKTHLFLFRLGYHLFNEFLPRFRFLLLFILLPTWCFFTKEASTPSKVSSS